MDTFYIECPKKEEGAIKRRINKKIRYYKLKKLFVPYDAIGFKEVELNVKDAFILCIPKDDIIKELKPRHLIKETMIYMDPEMEKVERQKLASTGRMIYMT